MVSEGPASSQEPAYILEVIHDDTAHPELFDSSCHFFGSLRLEIVAQLSVCTLTHAGRCTHWIMHRHGSIRREARRVLCTLSRKVLQHSRIRLLVYARHNHTNSHRWRA